MWKKGILILGILGVNTLSAQDFWATAKRFFEPGVGSGTIIETNDRNRMSINTLIAQNLEALSVPDNVTFKISNDNSYVRKIYNIEKEIICDNKNHNQIILGKKIAILNINPSGLYLFKKTKPDSLNVTDIKKVAFISRFLMKDVNMYPYFYPSSTVNYIDSIDPNPIRNDSCKGLQIHAKVSDICKRIYFKNIYGQEIPTEAVVKLSTDHNKIKFSIDGESLIILANSMNNDLDTPYLNSSRKPLITVEQHDMLTMEYPLDNVASVGIKEGDRYNIARRELNKKYDDSIKLSTFTTTCEWK